MNKKIEVSAKMLFLENYPVKSPRECIKRAIYDSDYMTEVSDTLRLFDITLEDYIDSLVKDFI